MDFIFMLTLADRTVPDCVELADTLESVGLTHVGFKDVGVDRATLHHLHERIKRSGASSYLEVVSTSPDRALESARMAVELGVDWLMGGTWVTETLAVLAGTGIGYLPFPGLPVGHPTRLGGTPELVAEHCHAYEIAGCAGVDLLAYRATEAAPLDLVHSARAATVGRLVVAGEIQTPQQIRDLAAAGVDSFTVGSAAIARKFAPNRPTLRDQLTAILHAAGQDGRR
jgi:hypothetical protein